MTLNCELREQCRKIVDPNAHMEKRTLIKEDGTLEVVIVTTPDPFGTAGIQKAAKALGSKPGEVIFNICKAEDQQTREKLCITYQELRSR